MGYKWKHPTRNYRLSLRVTETELKALRRYMELTGETVISKAIRAAIMDAAAGREVTE